MTLKQQRLISLGVFFGTLVGAVLFLVAFDIWIVANWGRDATISRSMHDAPPIVVFATGFFTGGITWGMAFHFWWGAKPTGSP